MDVFRKKNIKFRPMEKVWGEAGRVTWGETFCFFVFFHGFWGIFGPRWQKHREHQKKANKTKSFDPWRGSAEKLDRWHGVIFFPWFWDHFSSFRIWIVCMRVWDRSKLQEWTQISRQDDFKQTLQNMRVSTMCTPSTPSSSLLFFVVRVFFWHPTLMFNFLLPRCERIWSQLFLCTTKGFSLYLTQFAET